MSPRPSDAPRPPAAALSGARSPARVPVLASDVTRGLLAMIPAFAITIVAEIVLIVITDVEQTELTAAAVLMFWALYAAIVIVFTTWAFGGVDSGELARRLKRTAGPTGRWRRALWSTVGGGAVSWAVTGSVIAVVAVVGLALNPDIGASPLVTWSAVAAIAASWAVTTVSYAVRIARENVTAGGAEFAGEQQPRFSDYVYTAVQLGTTFSGSDVTFTTRAMRTVVTTNSIISFTFNTVIVALLVSVLIARVG